MFAEIFLDKRLHRTDAIAELVNRLRKNSEKAHTGVLRVDEYCAAAGRALPVNAARYLMEMRNEAACDKLSAAPSDLNTKDEWRKSGRLSEEDAALCRDFKSVHDKVQSVSRPSIAV